MMMNCFCLLLLASNLLIPGRDPIDPAVNERLDLDKVRLELAADRLTAVPLFESCSLYLKTANPPEQHVVRFRAKGEREWREGFPLVASPEGDMLRGSLVNLREDTGYEAEVNFGEQKFRVDFTTWNPAPPVKKTVRLDRLKQSDGPLVISDRGTPDGWVRYTAPPGFVLKRGVEAAAAIRLLSARYVILENLAIEGGRNGISLENSQHIRIVNCDISQWGRVGRQDIVRTDADSGKYFSAAGELINVEAGIRVANSGNLAVERCYIHSPRGDTITWRFQHPAGPNGMLFYWCTGGVVLRYNDVVGNDGNRWNDAIGGYSNWARGSGFYRDSDIYGNLLAFANDDALELDGGQMNLRVFRNYFTETLCGVSTGPNMQGPSYIFDNLFAFAGDDGGHSLYAFKNGHQRYDPGRVFFFNNTIHDYAVAYGPYNLKEKKRHGELKGFSRNNIYHASYPIRNTVLERRNDFDYDLFFSPVKGQVAQLEAKLKKLKLESHGLFDIDPAFTDPAQGDFTLRDGSPALGAGTAAPNFIAGTRPDLGALRRDASFRQLPDRPAPFRTDRARLEFPDGPAAVTLKLTVTVDAVPGYEQPFTVRQNRNVDWFEVTPASGVLRAGDRLEFTVRRRTDRPAVPGRQRGIFLIRSADGYSRPVAVYGRNPAAPEKLVRPGFTTLYLEAEAPAAGPRTGIADDPECFGGQYLRFDQRQSGEEARTYEFELPADGFYTILGRVRSPGRPHDMHNTLLVTLDGAEPFAQFFNASAEWTWGGFNFGDKGARRIHRVKLAAGRHTLTLAPRAKGPIELDALLITDDPETYSDQKGRD